MKLRLLFVGACATGLFLIPLSAHAAPGVGSGTCTTSTHPYPPSGAKKATIPGVPPGSPSGTAYAGGTTSNAGAGAYGSHGWIQTSRSATSGASTSGYSNDTGHLNGYGKANGTTVAICMGFNGKTVHS